MSITDELRLFAADPYTGWVPTDKQQADLRAIADRIDAEHERLMAERRRSCVFYDAERNYCMGHDEWDTADFGWIRLPKDADGEYIRIGDVMEWPDGKTFDVIGIGEGGLFYPESECDGPAEWTGASTKRHHYAPTVEDVLREMLDAWGELPSNASNEAIIAEYAAKLRLAEREDV